MIPNVIVLDETVKDKKIASIFKDHVAVHPDTKDQAMEGFVNAFPEKMFVILTKKQWEWFKEKETELEREEFLNGYHTIQQESKR